MYFIHNERTYNQATTNGPGIINRAFSYGDGFFETMRYTRGIILQLEHHIERMLETAMQLRLRFRERPEAMVIESKVHNLARLNQHDEARVRITVFRSGGGRYTPDSMAADMLIQTWQMEETPYPDHATIRVDTSADVRLAPGMFSSLKLIGRQEQVIAAMECEEKHLDDLLLLNNDGIVAEAISSNVFIMIDGVLYLPEDGLGQVRGIMQGVISHLAAADGIAVSRGSVTQKMLEDASEVFLTNSINGAVPVGEFAGKKLDTFACNSLQKRLRASV